VAIAQHEIAVKGVTEQIQQSVADHTLPYDQAKQAYTDQVAKIPVPQIANLDPAAQVEMQGHIQQHVALNGLAIDGTTALAKKADYKDQFVQLMDAKGKLAGMPGADVQGINDSMDAFRPLAVQAGLAPADIDRALDAFKEQNWFGHAAQREITNKDNPHGLQLLQHDLVDNDGFYAGKLGVVKRTELFKSVVDDQRILENRADHEQDKREAHATAAIDRLNMQIASAVPLSAAMWAKAEADTKGTAMEGEFRQAMADETTVQAVLRESPAQQQQYIQEQQQKLDTQGGTVRDAGNLTRLKIALKNNQTMMENTPLQFLAVRTGHDFPPLALQDMDKPEGQQQVGAQVSDRMSSLAAARKQYGPQIGLLPLMPQEAAQIGSRLESSTPQDRMSMLTALHQSFHDDDAYQAAMRQIAPHSPVTAIVGQMLGNSQPASTPVWFDRNFASRTMQDGARVLAGDALLNPPKTADDEKGAGFKNGFPLPDKADSGQDLQQYFAQKAGDLFRDRPQLADAHFAVFRAAYAGLLAEQGNMKGVADQKLEQRALDIALGTKAQLTDFHGGSVRVPDGMDPTKFEGLVNNTVAGIAKSTGAGADWVDRIRGYQLEEIGGLGSGQYKVMNGTLPVAMPRSADAPKPAISQPLIIDLRRQYLPGTTTAAATSSSAPTIDPARFGAARGGLPGRVGATSAQQAVIDRQVAQDSGAAVP